MTDLLTLRNAIVTFRNLVQTGGLDSMQPAARAASVAQILNRCIEMAEVTDDMQRALHAAEAETKRVRALLAAQTPGGAAGA